MIKLTVLVLLISLPTYAKVVDLEWEPVESASQYEIKIDSLNDKKKKPLRKRVRKSKWKGNLSAGHYSMQIRSFDERRVPGDWSEAIDFWIKVKTPLIISPKHKSKIFSEGQDLPTQDVEFKWETLDEAKFYKVGVESKDKTISIEKITDKPSIVIPLKTSNIYSWTVIGLSSKEDTTPLEAKKMKFVVIGSRMLPPEINNIESKFVQSVGWKKNNLAYKYSYALMRKNKKDKWKIVERKKNVKKSEVPFNKDYLGGTYQLLVKAYGKLRKSSKFARKEFTVAYGDRSPASARLNELKESIEKPNKYYMIASWFVSQLSIESRNDAGVISPSTSIPSAPGGTGRIGLGYQSIDNPWGAFAIADASGFKLFGENKIYNTLELLGTYKKTFNSGSQLQFGLGLYEKGLPLITQTLDPTNPDFDKLTQTGLTFSTQYWKPFSKTYGMQLRGQVYVGGTSGSNPNGTDILPSLSNQLSIFGSKRVSDSIFGYMGYTYKKESISFKPSTTVTDNFSSIDGHFFSLKLELGF